MTQSFCILCSLSICLPSVDLFIVTVNNYIGCYIMCTQYYLHHVHINIMYILLLRKSLSADTTVECRYAISTTTNIHYDCLALLFTLIRIILFLSGRRRFQFCVTCIYLYRLTAYFIENIKMFTCNCF